MTNRLDALRATLRRERAGLVAELETKRAEVDELTRALRALDAMIGTTGESQGNLFSDSNERGGRGQQTVERDELRREKDMLRQAIVATLKAAPDGLSSLQLAEQIQLDGEPVSSRRISQLCRWIEQRGEGIVGDPECWIYVAGDDEESPAQA